ncbi:MAG: leucine-rich repeat domain-containing protein [Crocinitomicaceae bacterium]|nr:leucine-rich repeat domain-containing protein [Crocinitomicaceae bacterium]
MKLLLFIFLSFTCTTVTYGQCSEGRLNLSRDYSFKKDQDIGEILKNKENKERITVLNLSDLDLKEVPLEILLFPNLQALDLSSNDIEELPDELFTINSLRCLDVGFNLLSSLSDSIVNLKNLFHLDISANRYHGFPPSILGLTSLEQLFIGQNDIQVIPQEIGKLKELTYLNIPYANLSTLSNSICELYKLEHLNAANNELAQLPESIGQLDQLVEIDLTYNQLFKLPKSFGNLTNLESLSIYGNELFVIPSYFENYQQLTHLDLRDNNIQSFPDELCNLSKLESLWISGNQIKKLPDSIGSLTNLDDLNITGNELIELPESFFSFGHNFAIDIGGNPLLESVKDSIRLYYHSNDIRKTRSYPFPSTISTRSQWRISFFHLQEIKRHNRRANRKFIKSVNLNESNLSGEWKYQYSYVNDSVVDWGTYSGIEIDSNQIVPTTFTINPIDKNLFKQIFKRYKWKYYSIDIENNPLRYTYYKENREGGSEGLLVAANEVNYFKIVNTDNYKSDYYFVIHSYTNSIIVLKQFKGQSEDIMHVFFK